MKIQDLSVGDWVRVINQFDAQIYGYHCESGSLSLKTRQGHLVYYRLEDINPIPLTPEILEKNGFVKEEDEDGSKRYSLIEGGTKFSLGYARSVFQWTFPIDVRYVHELQHFLRICGVGKEIEL